MNGASCCIYGRIPLVAIAALALAAAPLNAQATGTVQGTVTNGATGQPVNGAQVLVDGTGIGTLTGNNGRYMLLNVPTGEATIVVSMIGYGRVSETVEVGSDETVVVDLEITESAIALDEIIVTGSAAATERRAVGNSIASVDAAEVVEEMPVATVDQLIMGRSAGVNMSLSGGGGNFGGQIRMRGVSSVSLQGAPVIYVDGVRVDAQHDNESGIYIGGQTMSRILDLAPADIERVEIVKGAAAASLYGTEGSNGVIQIFTKRGRTGDAQWNFVIEGGLERVPTDTFPGRLFPNFVGPDGYRARDPVEIVENGYRNQYRASVSGGSQDTQYYLSGGWKSQEGSIAPNTNWLKQFSARANISTLVGEDLTITATSGFTSTRVRVPDNDNALHGTYSQIASAVPYTATPERPYGERFGSFEANQTVENRQRVLRSTTGLTVEHQLLDNVRQRLTTGVDWYTDEFTKFFPFAYKGSGNRLGNKENETRTFRDITVDYRFQVDNELLDDFSSTFVVGAQGDFRNTVRLNSYGTDFPAPGVSSIDATATTTGSENRVEEVNAGVFFQETVGLWDKLFLTGGVRVDGNSAFGDQFHSESYPKASVAYNISDESFWPQELVSTMKLRVAYGESGLAPEQFVADRTYQPVSAQDGRPAVTPGNIGNPELGPEKSQEIEVGFDAGLWNDRIGLEVTGYRQRTVDALLEVPYPPSQGFLNEQLTNIGEVRNQGIEAGVNALLVEAPNYEWSANAQFSASRNEVTDLGGIAPFTIRGGRIAEGFPVMGQWGYTLKEWDPETRQHIASDTMVFYGQADPKWFGSLTSDLRYRRFSFRGMLEFTGGQVKRNFERYWSIRVRTGDEYLSLLADERGTPTAAADSLRNYAVTLGSGAYIEPAGFTSLRELSIGYDIPNSWLAATGLENSSIRLSARNVWMWSEYSGISPEASRRDGVLGYASSFDTQAVPRVFLLTFRTSM